LSEARRGEAPRYTDDAVTGPLSPQPSHLLIYRWSETAAELEQRGRKSDDPLVAIEYTNPQTGSSVLPTMACALHRVRGHSQAVRRAGNAVYVVFSGQGESVIDGQRFSWGPGDMFVVPSWSAVEHIATQADLFVLSDEPVLRALGIARRQVLPEPQQVTSEFPRSPLNSAGKIQ
jgi:gentisate 1,2-dioxygenase